MSRRLNLELVIGANAQGVRSTLNGVSESVDNVHHSVTGMNPQVRNSESALRGMGKAAVSAVAAFAGFSALKGIIDTSRQFEVLRSSLVTVSESALEAEARFAAIQQFAAETPFSVDQATEAFLRLKSIGLDGSKGALESYGNTASAMGKSLMDMVEAVADAATGEFERLKEFGITSKQQGDQVELTFKGVTTTVKKNSEDIQKYLMNIGNTDFAGAMKERAKTVDGVLSNMGDAFDRLRDSIGQGGLNDAIKAIGPAISGAMDSMADFFNSGVLIETVKQEWALWADLLGRIPEALGLSGGALSSFIDKATTGFSSYIDFVQKFWMDLPVNIQIAVTKMAGFVDQGVATMSHYFDGLEISSKALWSGIAEYAEDAWGDVKLLTAKTMDWIARQFGKMLGKLEKIGAAIDFLPGIDGVEKKLSAAAKSLKSYEGSEKAVRKEISKTQRARDDHAKSLAKEKKQIDAAYKARIKGSKSAVKAAVEEGRQALKNRDTQIKLTRELYKAEKAELALEAASLDSSTAHAKHTSAAAKTKEALKKEAAEAKKAAKEADNLAKKEAKATAAHNNHRASTDLLISSLSETVDVMGNLDTATDDLIQRAFELGLSEEELAVLLNETTKASLNKSKQMASDADKNAESADATAKAWETGMKRIDDSFSEAFKNGFQDMKSFGKNIIGSLKDTLAEMAYQWAKSKFFEYLQGLGQQGGFFGGLASSFNSAVGNVATNESVKYGKGKGASGVDGSSLAWAGVIAAGRIEISDWLEKTYGKSAQKKYETAGVWGTGIEAGISILASGGDYKTVGAGVDLSYKNGDFSGQNFNRQRKKGRWGGKGRNRTRYEEIDSQLQDSISSSLDRWSAIAHNLGESFNPDGVPDIAPVTSIFNTIANHYPEWADKLGIESKNILQSIDSALADVTSIERIDLRGLSGEEIQAKLDEWTMNVGKKMIKAVLPQMDGLIERAGERFTELIQPLLDIADYVSEDWQPRVKESLMQQASNSFDAAAEQLTIYNGSVESTKLLAASVTERYQYEVALLEQVAAVSASVDTLTGSIKDRIDKTLRTEQEQLAFLDKRAQELKAQLSVADDPEEINRLVQEIASLTGEKISIIGKEGLESAGDEIKAFMDEVNAISKGRLEEIEAVAKAQHDVLADGVQSALADGTAQFIDSALSIEDSVKSSMSEAAAELKTLAPDFKDAAKGIAGAAQSFESGVAGSIDKLSEADLARVQAQSDFFNGVAGDQRAVIESQQNVVKFQTRAAQDQSAAAKNTDTAARSMNNAAGSIIDAARILSRAPARQKSSDYKAA